jgi:hypothetical protein
MWGEKGHACRFLVGIPEGRSKYAGPRHRWSHNLTMNPKEIVPEGAEWIHRALDRRKWRAVASD